MLEERIGGVIVTRDGAPIGIVTESDVLRAGVATDRPLSTLPVARVMSHPIERVAPGSTVTAAARTMRERGIKRLLVADGLTPIGIVTLSDLVDNLSDIQKEAADLTRAHVAWDCSARYD
jgi:CBS domain-containing protein